MGEKKRNYRSCLELITKCSLHPLSTDQWHKTPTKKLKKGMQEWINSWMITPNTHTPDLVLDVSREVVGSGLFSSIGAVSVDLVSIHWDGLGTVPRGGSFLHHSTSLCTILNKHRQAQNYVAHLLNNYKKYFTIKTVDGALHLQVHVMSLEETLYYYAFSQWSNCMLPWWAECSLFPSGQSGSWPQLDPQFLELATLRGIEGAPQPWHTKIDTKWHRTT